ncbi:MAG TPA: energy-coupling factor transporter transmembrane component T [candidate division Zixibacteria bacterium]|nr:energy-coupling factor transporter transmembrane component T [candidate division Zixibacteria bacterium]
MAFIHQSERIKEDVKNQIDPRSKLVVLLAVSILSVSINDFFFLFTLFDVILLVIILSNIDLFKIWRFVKPTIWLILPIFIIQLFFSYDKSGPLVVFPEYWKFHPGYVLISTGSIFSAGSISIRILILALSSTFFSLTTDTYDFLVSLRKIKIPYELAIVTGLIIYFLPMVISETSAARNALETRGASIRKGRFVSRLKTFRILITSILMNFIEKSKFQAIAMETRGFNSKSKKTTFRNLQMHFVDYMIILVTLCLISGITYYFWEEIIQPWRELELIAYLISIFKKE